MFGNDAERIDIGPGAMNSETIGTKGEYLPSSGIRRNFRKATRQRHLVHEFFDDGSYPSEYRFPAKNRKSDLSIARPSRGCAEKARTPEKITPRTMKCVSCSIQ